MLGRLMQKALQLLLMLLLLLEQYLLVETLLGHLSRGSNHTGRVQEGVDVALGCGDGVLLLMLLLLLRLWHPLSV